MDGLDVFSKPYPQAWWERVAISMLLVVAFVVFILPAMIGGLFHKRVKE